MDLCIKDTIENRGNIRKAFKNCDMGDYYMMETTQIVPGWTSFNLNNGLKLDLLLDVKGLEGYSFDECLKMSSKAEIEGIIFPFLHINHLIESKKAANRPKDQLMLLILKK